MGVALDQLVVRLAQENRDWGYDRIVGAVANLGYVISDQTVLVGTDFLSVEVLTPRGLVTNYVLFFIHL